jgi:hypothetical protein
MREIFFKHLLSGNDLQRGLIGQGGLLIALTLIVEEQWHAGVHMRTQHVLIAVITSL